MKIFFLLTACFLFLKDEQIIEKKSAKKIDKIIINCTELGAMTEIQINCDRFESAFSGDIRQFIIEDSNAIQRIIGFLNYATQDKAHNGYSVDTRTKLLLEYNSKNIGTLCVDGTGRINLKGTNWDLAGNNQLLSYIDSLYRSQGR